MPVPLLQGSQEIQKKKKSKLACLFTDNAAQPPALVPMQVPDEGPSRKMQRTKDFDFIDAINETINMCDLPLTAVNLSIDAARPQMIMQVARQCMILLFFKEGRWDVKGIDSLGESDNIPEIDENTYYILSKLRKDMQTSLANAVFKHVQAQAAAAAAAQAEKDEADVAAKSAATAATYVGLPMDVDLDLRGQPTGSMGSPDNKTSVVRLRDFVVKSVMAHPNLVMLHPAYELLSKKVSTNLCNFLTNEHHDLPSKKWIVGSVVTCVDEHFPVEWLIWLGYMIQQYAQASTPEDDESQALGVTQEQQDAIDTLTAIFGIKHDGDAAADTNIDEELMYATLTARTQYIYTVLQTLLRSTTDLPTLDERLISKLNIKEKQVAEGGGSIYGFGSKRLMRSLSGE